MRFFVALIFAVAVLTSCDNDRVYENNLEFSDRLWKAADTARFQFAIKDPSGKFNLYCNVRNTMEYPWARLFVQYSLCDSTGRSLQTKLISGYLFDQKTGKPFGNSGLGDVYDHQFPLITGFVFPRSGKYTIKLEQFMREDSLRGILAVGARVETAR